MTDLEMDSIKVDHTPMGEQRPLMPGGKLLGHRLVQTTDAAGTRSHSHQGLSNCSYFVSTGPRDEHLCQAISNLWFVAVVVLKGLGLELAFTVSWHLEVFDGTCGRHEV